MKESGQRRIWTRDGMVELTPVQELATLGLDREERNRTLITQYADRQEPELRDATRDAYIRAYQQAGLLNGDPDEATAMFPAAEEGES